MITDSVLVWRPKAAGKYSPVGAPKVENGCRRALNESNKLPRNCSLKSRLEISRLFDKGARLSGEFFAVRLLNADRFQYGLFVGRRHGGAIVRNRIKRLFREAVRLNRQTLTREWQIAIVPKTTSANATFGQINADIRRIFEQINDRSD